MSSSEASLDSLPPHRGVDDIVGPPKPPSSLASIRWLLLVGALVVTVSVIRLVAAEWQHLTPIVQFLILVAGALSVWAAGDVTQRRLHLPLAGSALQALFVFLVPLLAWGAAHQGLMETGLGALAVLAGLFPLVWAGRGLLRRHTGYDGILYPAVFGLLLAAIPGLPALSYAFFLGEGFFLAAALGLGILVRQGSRHINRFFFHRDRLSGVDRPVHGVPFAMLLVAYGAAMTSFDVPMGWLVVPLMMAAWALLDSGEEYYHALVEAAGQPVVRWPRRSVLLLTAGFASMAVALGAAPFAAWPRGWAVVCLLATARLLMWALRYRSAVAYGAGMIVGVLAYHAVPALVPSLAQEIYQWLLRSLGLSSGGVALLSLADLGLMALLLFGAVRWRRHLSPAMLQVHTAIFALQSTVVLLSGLMEPRALRWGALLALPLVLGGVRWLRRIELLPLAYGALVCAALSWGWQSTDLMLWSSRGALLTALGTAVYLGLGWLRMRQRDVKDRLWLVVPTLCGTVPLALMAVTLGELAGVLWLLLTPSFALTALLLRRPSWGVLPGISTSLGVFGLVAFHRYGCLFNTHSCRLANHIDPVILLGWAFLGLVGTGWVLSRLAGRELPSKVGHWMGNSMAVFSGVLGGVLLLFFGLDRLDWQPLLILLFGAYIFDTAARYGGLRALRATVLPVEQALAGVGLSLMVLYPMVQWAVLHGAARSSTPVTGVLGVLTVTLAGLAMVSRQTVARRVTSFYSVEVDGVHGFMQQVLQAWLRLWRVAVAIACLVWAGPWALLLAAVLAAEAIWRRSGRGLTPPPIHANGLQLGVTFLPLLHLIEQLSRAPFDGTERLLLPVFVEARGLALPLLMAAVWIWCAVMRRLLPPQRRPQSLMSWAQALAAAACLWPLLLELSGTSWAHVHMSIDPTFLLAAYAIPAVAFALWSVFRAWRDEESMWVWGGQAWLMLAGLHGLASPWLGMHTPSTAALWVLLAVGLDGAAAYLRRRVGERTGRDAVVQALDAASVGWGVVGSAAAVWVALSQGAPWWPIMPLVMASLFYTLRARRGLQVEWSAGMASGLFALACTVWVFRLPILGPEMYFLGPGLALMALSWLLEPRLDAVTRNRLFTSGAVAVYGTPMMGLLGELGWIWQIALLLVAIVFGALSFRLRSRSLLTVSTAAVVVDLVFFLVKLRRSEPTLLWVGGIAFGLALMAAAALLEHRREDVQQRLRVWGRALSSWD